MKRAKVCVGPPPLACVLRESACTDRRVRVRSVLPARPALSFPSPSVLPALPVVPLPPSLAPPLALTLALPVRLGLSLVPLEAVLLSLLVSSVSVLLTLWLVAVLSTLVSDAPPAAASVAAAVAAVAGERALCRCCAARRRLYDAGSSTASGSGAGPRRAGIAAPGPYPRGGRTEALEDVECCRDVDVGVGVGVGGGGGGGWCSAVLATWCMR